MMEINLRSQKIAVHKFINRYELDPIEVGDSFSFVFRIDVFKNLMTGLYFPKVSRRETFRLKLSFPGDADPTSDEDLYVEDYLDWEEIVLDSESAVIEAVLSKIAEIFAGGQ